MTEPRPLATHDKRNRVVRMRLRPAEAAQLDHLADAHEVSTEVMAQTIVLRHLRNLRDQGRR